MKSCNSSICDQSGRIKITLLDDPAQPPDAGFTSRSGQTVIIKSVSPLRAVVRLFVNTFGITQPTPEGEAAAGRVILGMLVGVLVLLVLLAWLLRSAIFR